MNCPLEDSRTPDVLVEFSAGRLDGEAAAGVRLHVAACPDCAAFCREQAAVWRALDTFEAPPVSCGFTRGLFARIEEEERSGFWRRLFVPRPAWGSFRPAAPVAIASVLALAILLLQVPYKAEFQQQAAVDAIDDDNLEQTVNDLDMIRQLSVPSQADTSSSQSM